MYNLNSRVMNRAMRVAPINNNIKTEAIVLQFFNGFIDDYEKCCVDYTGHDVFACVIM